MIHTINENKIVAYRVERGESGSSKPVVLATATRKRPGAIWNIWYRDHRKATTRSETVHARVSGKLPKEMQSRMVVNLLDIADH